MAAVGELCLAGFVGFGLGIVATLLGLKFAYGDLPSSTERGEGS
jgi:hypothetical protein